MTIGENIGAFWRGLSGVQKAGTVTASLIVAVLIVGSSVTAVQSWQEIRTLERAANTAKREAENALQLAAKIAGEKLEVERRLVEVEGKRDEKQKQSNDAKLKTLDARRDYERALRERRGDNPSTGQLCDELAALGYPCS